MKTPAEIMLDDADKVSGFGLTLNCSKHYCRCLLTTLASHIRTLVADNERLMAQNARLETAVEMLRDEFMAMDSHPDDKASLGDQIVDGAERFIEYRDAKSS